MYFGAVYVPNQGSTHENDHIFDLIEEDIAKFPDESLVWIGGDTNARCGHARDYDPEIAFEEPFNFDRPKVRDDVAIQNLVSTDKIVRKTRDNTINDYGKKLISLCKATSMLILNGRCSDPGDFTFDNVTGKVLSIILLAVLGYLNTSNNFR